MLPSTFRAFFDHSQSLPAREVRRNASGMLRECSESAREHSPGSPADSKTIICRFPVSVEVRPLQVGRTRDTPIREWIPSEWFSKGSGVCSKNLWRDRPVARILRATGPFRSFVDGSSNTPRTPFENHSKGIHSRIGVSRVIPMICSRQLGDSVPPEPRSHQHNFLDRFRT